MSEEESYIHEPFRMFAPNGYNLKVKGGKIMDVLLTICSREGLTCEAVNVILTDDAKLNALNTQFAGHAETTDVLAFDLKDSPQDNIEGDIYVSLERAASQALDQAIDLEDEVLNLVTHGFLHLCGYDHKDEASLKTMVKRGEEYISLVNCGSAGGH
ncbi:MAG: rRNA maturation RNase YbeY [Calditrichota bacterium]